VRKSAIALVTLCLGVALIAVSPTGAFGRGNPGGPGGGGGDTAALAARVAALETKVAELQQGLGQLTQTVDALEQRVAALENPVDELQVAFQALEAHCVSMDDTTFEIRTNVETFDFQVRCDDASGDRFDLTGERGSYFSDNYAPWKEICDPIGDSWFDPQRGNFAYRCEVRL
jgi:uncharacterized coiled-coil protein SlyX